MASLYEQTREARIRENKERMQQLGLKELSLKLKSSATATPGRRSYKNRLSFSDQKTPTPLPPRAPVRRSSRLQNVTPVSYTEQVLTKKDEHLEGERSIRLQEGSKPEVYTEKHEKLLGNTERIWTLFEDGFGKDGRRIYDPIKGKTCHQCRQKTLGHRTSCSNCNMVQGQFCGDCLYMRYGEHVLEAIDNPNWICPVCRGICNCSLCRQAKGWAPTGSLYRRITSLGFKSVAHYLIQTRRGEADSEKISDTVNQNTAKRSLSFLNTDVPSKDSLQIDDYHLAPFSPQVEDKGDDEYTREKEGKSQTSPNALTDNQFSAKRSLPFSNIEAQSNAEESAETDVQVLAQSGLSKLQVEDKKDNEFKYEKEKKSYVLSERDIDCSASAKVNLKVHVHAALPKPQLGDKVEDEFKCERETESNFINEEHSGSNITLEPVKVDLEVHDQLGLSKPAFEDKSRELPDKEMDNEQIDSINASETCQELQKKRAFSIGRSSESHNGRPRQRRRTVSSHENESTEVNEGNSDIKEAGKDIMSENEVVKQKEVPSSDEKHGDGRNLTLKESSKPRKKPTGPCLDSIGGRLRQRRATMA